MTDKTVAASSHWASLTSAATAAVIVGFASTILVVIEGARAVGANAAQQASTAAILCFAMAAASLYLAVRHRMPIMVAWSTPGSALIISSAHGAITWPEAIGAFIFAGVLMVLTGLVRPLERAIERMPAAIAAAMLAGVLLRFVLAVPGATLASPLLVGPLVIAFFALRIFVPMYTVPVVVGLGLLLALFGSGFTHEVQLGITPLTFDLPQWNWQVMLSLGLPLYLVTMASQNLPGFAVLKANGYSAPVSSCLTVTGITSIICAPFGSHAVNMAAITASLVAGPDAHPDPQQRWKMIYPYTALYIVFGLAAGTFVSLLGALPPDIITAVAGLALFGPLMGGMSAMVKEPSTLEAALVTFLVTASGISLYGVGAAFWGLLAGLLLWGAKQALTRARS
ncbi:MAG: benzoate/H(+) symporter BenE family transporter [Proteobacteria bacterium]|nr:benzoate/H(+) symporter BenE family transporter [Pseudomonadota bacterium]